MTLIQHRRSKTSGSIPTSVADGELVLNQADGILYSANSGGAIVSTPLTGRAPLASPAFTGTPTTPLPGPTDNTLAPAPTSWVRTFINSLLASYATLSSPALSGTPTAPTPSAADNSQTVATTAFVATAGASSAANSDSVYAKKRNRFINPTHIVNQIPGAPSVASGYIVDGWFLVASAAGATGQQASVNGPNGSTARLRVTIGTAKASLASTDLLCIGHVVEVHRMSDLQWGLTAAKTVTLRFGFKGPAGSYTYTLRNGAANRCYLGSFTITAGQANTDTLQTAIIPGDVAGTWTSSAGISFYIALACGTSYQGPTGSWQGANLLSSTSQVNGWASTSNVFELFECGLYAGGVVPAFEPIDATQILIDCQRYYVVQTGTIMRFTNVGSYQGTVINVPKFSMRVAPSQTATNTGGGNYSGALSVSGDALSTLLWFGASGSIGDYTGYQVINDARF